MWLRRMLSISPRAHHNSIQTLKERLVDNMSTVFQVKRNVVGACRRKDAKLAPSVSITHFVEYVRIHPCHFGDNNISKLDLSVDSLKNALAEKLLVHPLRYNSEFRS